MRNLALLLLVVAAVGGQQPVLELISTHTGQSLDLSCTLQDVHSANISHIISMVMSKVVNGNDEVLASAISVGGVNPVTHNLDDAEVTSDLTWDGESDSYLHIHWLTASRGLEGAYKCTLNGLNSDNIPITLTATLNIVLDDTEPTLVATPVVIEVGLTRSLVLNCTVTDPSTLHLSTLTSIELSYLHNGIDQLLATASIFSGVEAKPGSGTDSVKGYIGSKNEGSYLEAHWPFPDLDNTGEFFCDVVGINTSNVPVQFSRRINVTSRDPPRDDLIERIHELELQNTKSDGEIQQMDTLITDLMAQVQQLRLENGNATANITTLSELFANATAEADDLTNQLMAVESTIGIIKDYTIFICNFDSGLCGFTQDATDEMDWTRNSGSTSSTNTGPNADHTTGSGYYLYLEASSGNTGDAIRLESQQFPANQKRPVCISFWYHMYGVNTGTLNVYSTRNGGSMKRQWSKQGEQGSSWIEGKITLPIDSGAFTVIFEAVRGASYDSDIAIDDIVISDINCP